MDLIFIEGVAVTVSAIIVFCGSIWLLLAMVLGPRLAYYVSASVTLGFLLIMGVVWSLPSISPLGPVGVLPEWNGVAIAEEGDQADFGPSSSYPDSGGWYAPDPEDAGDAAKASELKNGATDELEAALEDETLDSFESAGDASPNDDTLRFLDQDGTLYGGVVLEPVEGAEGDPVVVFLEYDPGAPLRPARQVTVGTALLLGLHLFGLSRAEKSVRRRNEALGV